MAFEKIANGICWAVVGILGLFFLVAFLGRIIYLVFGFAWLIAYSDLPWWILLPAAFALFSGITYLLVTSVSRRVPSNQKFLN